VGSSTIAEVTVTRRPQILVGALALIAPALAYAKPIAFAEGTTVMLEYGAGTMREAQIFYAPQYNYSVGAGHVEFDSAITTETMRVNYARLNYLLHRWNLESAQANVFMWGGAGSATGSTFSGTEFAVNAGGQADYETRRVYASLKTDLQKASDFSIRVDTLQLGIAPYEHDYNQIATWFVVQARNYTGGISNGTELAALVRFFKGGAWIEAGLTNGGKLQAMAMFNL
jgi:hypothetical protein